MLMKLSGRRTRRKPQRRLMDIAKEGVQRVGLTEKDARDWVRSREMIHCRGNHQKNNIFKEKLC